MILTSMFFFSREELFLLYILAFLLFLLLITFESFFCGSADVLVMQISKVITCKNAIICLT